MSLIPPLSTLRAEDFPTEVKEWIPRLFTPLNQFLTNASNAINGRIEFGINIPTVDQQINFTEDATARRFLWTKTQFPKVMTVGQAFENSIAIAVIPVWSFDPSTRVISVTFQKVNGQALEVGFEYKIFVRVQP